MRYKDVGQKYKRVYIRNWIPNRLWEAKMFLRRWTWGNARLHLIWYALRYFIKDKPPSPYTLLTRRDRWDYLMYRIFHGAPRLKTK